MKIVSLVSSLFTLSSITASDISTYFTLAFFAILLLLIIGFLIGLWRGMWNSGFRLIFIGILVACAFLFTRNIADWLASLDIKAMMSNFGVNLTDISFNMNSTTTITIEISNIKDMIISAVGQVYEAVGLGSASTTQAIELITGLTMIFLRYITFIIEVVLIILIGEPLAAFFYHVIFKWLLPRNVRKHMKVRLAGGFMNMVKVGLVSVMMLIPFSSLLNTINQAFQNPDNATAEGVDSATYNQIMSFLDAYNDSPFAQVLFNWSVNDEGKTLDVVLMDYLTNEDMGDVQLSLSTELYTIAGIGKTILSTGVADDGMTALATQLLSNENLVASLFVDIANSGLIMKAIPIALAIAMNMDQVKQYVDPSLLNFDEVDWHEELLNLGDIADQVVASGVVTDVMNADQATMVPTLLNALANPEKYPSIRQALADIDNSEFLAQVVPAVLYKLATDDTAPAEQLSVSDFLPSDWADYQDLHIGEELTLFYDCFYNMANDIDAAFLPTLIDVISSGGTGGSSAVQPHVMNAQSNQTQGESQHGTRVPSYVAGTGTMADLIDIIRAHVDEFVTILVGTLDSNGNPTGVTSDGKTDMTVAGAKPCMLDSSLLLYGMGNVLNYGLTAMMDSLTAGTGVTIDPATITVAVDTLQGANMAERRVNYKREYGSLLDIVGAAIQNDKLAALLGAAAGITSSSSAAVNPDIKNNDITPLRADSSSATSATNIVFDLLGDEEVRDLIKNEICPLIDRSVLMNAILPSVLESFISSASLADTLTLVGLVPGDFNFENLHIGAEIANFVDLAGYAMNLTDITGPDAINAIADHASDIVGVLDCIYNSNIINPKDASGNFLSDNYAKLLEAVFGQVADLGVNADDLAAAIASVPQDGWVTTYDNSGNVISYGENFYMIDTIVTAVNSNLFDLMDSSNVLADLNAPAYDGAISSVFAAVDRSIVMSGCFGSILDNIFGGTGGLLDPTGTGTSFRNVTDWTTEGENLEALIHNVADFGSDINNIDFMNSDPVLINNLLQGLAASQIFDKPDGTYLFGNFLFDKLISTSFKTYLYDKNETDVSYVGASAYDVAKSDFDSIGPTTSIADKAAWSDEIDRLSDLIGEVKIFTTAHGGTDAFASLTDGSATAAEIEPIILAANNCTILHMVIYNVFDSMLGGGAMDMGSLNPADANTAALITMTKEERDTEIGLTLDIYSAIQALGIDTGFTADKIDSAVIGTMLTNLHASHVFNTIKSENSRLAGDLTIFEQTVKMIFTTSTIDTYIYKNYAAELRDGMLEDTIFGIGNNLAGTTSDPDGWIGVNGEIAHLVAIMETYKATEIDFTDLGADAGAVVTDLMSTSEGKAKVENLLIAINHSAIAYPAIPNLLNEVLGTSDFDMGDVHPADSNTAILMTLDVNERDAEISGILDIHGAIQDLGLDTGFTADKIDSVKITNLLTLLHDSKIFNTLKPTKDRLAGDLTVFEQTVKMIFTTSQIDTYIYKKYALPLHSDMLSDDIIGIGNDFAGTTADPDGWIGVNGEIASLANIMETYKATAIDFTDLGTDAGATVTGLMATPEGKAKVENMLIAINHDQIAYPAIPNLFDDVLGTSDFVMGDLHPADSNTAILLELDVNERDAEISGILDIHTAIQDLGLDTGFTADKIDSAKISDLLTMLHDSKIFNTLKADKDRLVSDLTVFEQMAKMIFTTSSIDTYIYKKYALPLHSGMLSDDLIAIGNNFAGTTADPDGWLGVNGEIASLANIMETYKATAIDFTDLGTDAGATVTGLMATPEGKAKVENMLIAINHDPIAYPAIPNLFDDVLGTSDFNMGDLHPADSNTAILLELDVNERDAEITGILDIHTSIQDLGIDTGFTADKIDSVKIGNLLTQLHDSKVFNTIKAENDRLAGDLTVFEQMAKMIYTTSQLDTYIYKKFALPLHDGMLTDDLIGIGNNMAETEPEVDGWIGVNGQIAKIVNIMETYKATAIDFTDLGTDGGGTVTTLMATPEGTVKVQNMLIAINHDLIAYPAIPNLFDDVLGTGDFQMGDLDPSDANTAIMLTLDESTRDAEIINVLDIHDSIKGLGIDTGFTADKIDGDAINTLLIQLHESNIFNTIKAEKSRLLDDLTVFEQTAKMIITSSTLDGYIYKLYAIPLRSGLLSDDIITIGNDMYGNNAEVDGWMGAGNEIEKLVGIMNAFKDTAINFTDFGTDGAETVSGLMDTPAGTAKVENLLLSINHSAITYPAIPNLFDTMLTATDVTMTGVDMATANTHYTGDRFMAPYDDPEITQVLAIYGDMKNISSLNYTNLSLLSNADIDSAEILLNDFEQSKIFHLEGAASGIDADPTVFEQMVVKIMDDTGMAAEINDTLNPNPAYYNGLVYKFANAHEKALYAVTNYGTLYTAGNFFTHTWEGAGGEIESFLRVFRELKRIIPTMTTTTIDTSGLTPENVSDILAVLNYSNLGSDAVPKLVRDTFTTMSISTYTEGHEQYYLNVKQYDATELDQKDYTDYPDTDPTTVKTGLLHVMLNGFWDESVDPDAYIDMGGAFSLADYINGGKSTKNLMQFLEGSQMFAPVVEDDHAGIYYETRSLMFYNLLDNVDMTKYIRPLTTGTKATRSTQLEDIFAGDFDYVMEGNGLDALIVDLINLTTVSDTTSLEGQGLAAAGLIDSTYLAAGDTITDRAYMSSELTAGFYTDVLEADYALAETNLGHAVTVIDFYTTDFEQLCPREARGTEAVLSIVPEINAIVTAPTTQAEVDELRSSFVSMGSVAACTAPGPVWFDGNSNIAQLIYASRVISNVNFVAAVAVLAFSFPPVIVEDDPYVNGFVFETEGNKMCDYFETFI